ncbi:MAG: aminopeptidase P N-terminal domain-containing protein [Pseudomonadota bacterium]
MQAYQQRRAKLAQQLKRGVVVLPTALEKIRNADTHYGYRFDSNFYYLTGFREPEAILVIIAGKQPRSILFCREKNLEREIWDGYRYGPKAARKAFAMDETYPITALEELLPQLLQNQPSLYTPIGFDKDWDQQIIGWLNQVRGMARSGVSAPAEIRDVREAIAPMRLIKDDTEIAVMHRAAVISSEAHKRAMRAAKNARFEYEVEAELLHEFKRNGSQAPAYGSIVAAGANACVLHYVENSARIKKGDLMLIDAGCELDGYASDITRTFPISGKFSGPQKDVYELVLASQLAAIKAVKPGAPFIAYHDAAVKVLAQGMIDLKLCKGSRDKVIETGDYRRFYMHRTGHWLGLDVHDVGLYKEDGKWIKLAPGMVLTVEPGMYIRPADNVPKAFWNIGVRIEDDVLVTKKGREVLTESCPKTVADIEAVMAS